MIDFDGAKKELITWLDRLPTDLTYHSKSHTMDVYNAVTKIAKSQQRGELITGLLQVAALGHDLGYLNQYKNNEPIGADTTINFLPKYGFTSKHIEIVKNLILATQVIVIDGKITQSPQNELEEIICDADLVSLSFHPEYSMERPTFIEQSLGLKKEIEKYNKTESSNLEWYQNQLNFLMQHQYFTKYAWQNYEIGKLANKVLLQELIKIEKQSQATNSNKTKKGTIVE